MKCYFEQDEFHQNKYPKSAINKLFDKWLKKEYSLTDAYDSVQDVGHRPSMDYENAIVEVARQYGIETPLSKEEKIQVLKDNGVIE